MAWKIPKYIEILIFFLFQNYWTKASLEDFFFVGEKKIGRIINIAENRSSFSCPYIIFVKEQFPES